MVRKNIIYIYVIGVMLTNCFLSCIPTYKAKNRLPYYNKDIGNSKDFGQDGFYYSKSKWSENSDFYYARFFHPDGMYVAYLIEDSNNLNFEDKLQKMVKNNASPNTWGTYIIESDTLRLQTTPYKAKHNFFTGIPSTEHIYLIKDRKLTYQYSFSLKGSRKGDRFVPATARILSCGK